MAARPVTTISAAPALPRTSKTYPAGPATPTGLRTGGGPEEMRVGARAVPRTHATMAAAELRRQRVNLVVDQGGRGHGQGQHPHAQRSPEGGPWRRGVATGGLRRSRATRCHLSPLAHDYSPVHVRAEGCEPLPGRRPPP